MLGLGFAAFSEDGHELDAFEVHLEALEGGSSAEEAILAHGGLPDATAIATRETSRGSKPGDCGSKPGDLLPGVEVVHRRAADGREVPALEVEPGR